MFVFFGYPKGTVRTIFLYSSTYRYFNKQCHEDEILQAMKTSSYTHKASSRNLLIVSFTTLSIRMETFFNLLHAHVKLQKPSISLSSSRLFFHSIYHSVLPISRTKSMIIHSNLTKHIKQNVISKLI